MSTVELAGLEISRIGLRDAIAACRLATGYACFVNIHTLTEATSDPALHAALCGARFRFADGAPLVWLSRHRGAPIAERVAGPDVMAALVGPGHALIGGGPGIAQRIAASRGGIPFTSPFEPFSEAGARATWDAFTREHGVPRYAWIGLGAPKQERWVAAVAPHAPSTMFFAVGAAFDYLAGHPRAPAWMQRYGLEWTYRLAHDPRRLWRRYLVAGAKLAALSVRPERSRRPTARGRR